MPIPELTITEWVPRIMEMKINFEYNISEVPDTISKNYISIIKKVSKQKKKNTFYVCTMNEIMNQ